MQTIDIKGTIAPVGPILAKLIELSPELAVVITNLAREHEEIEGIITDAIDQSTISYGLSYCGHVPALCVAYTDSDWMLCYQSYGNRAFETLVVDFDDMCTAHEEAAQGLPCVSNAKGFVELPFCDKAGSIIIVPAREHQAVLTPIGQPGVGAMVWEAQA